MSSRSKRNKSGGQSQSNPAQQSGNQSQQQSELVAMQAEYRGPLPHPDMLERYEQVHPGTAERIIQRFEKEAEHRQSIEREVVAAQISRDKAEVGEIRRGQVFAFIIGAVGLLVGGAVSLFSETDAGAYAGAGIGGATLVGLVTAFIVGRKAKPPEQTEQTKK